MDRILDLIVVVFGVVCMGISLTAMILGPVYALRTMASLKPGIRWRDAPVMNPFNQLLDSRNFTEDGLRYRRRLGYAIAAFILPILAMLMVAMITRRM